MNTLEQSLEESNASLYLYMQLDHELQEIII
jgi:hypothetical protein